VHDPVPRWLRKIYSSENSSPSTKSVKKLLEMFRVFYNYVLVGMDKQTPAMRLGLAKGRVSLEDIVHFQP
jgi:hypothetical protein